MNSFIHTPSFSDRDHLHIAAPLLFLSVVNWKLTLVVHKLAVSVVINIVVASYKHLLSDKS